MIEKAQSDHVQNSSIRNNIYLPLYRSLTHIKIFFAAYTSSFKGLDSLSTTFPPYLTRETTFVTFSCFPVPF